MTSQDDLWEAVCALPVVEPEAMGETVAVGTARRIHDCQTDDKAKTFSVYRIPAGVLALVAVPETTSFRLHFAPNGYPAAMKVLSLVGDCDECPPRPSEAKIWDGQLIDAI